MKRFFVILISPICILAAFEDISSGPVSDALGNSYTALALPPDGIYYNPAGLSQINKSGFGTFYRSIFSGLEVGLRTLQFTTFLSLKEFNPAFSIRQTSANFREKEGYDTLYAGEYNETLATLTLAKGLTQDFLFGLNLNYFSLKDPRFGSKGSFGIDVGFIIKLLFAGRWNIGASFQNLNTPKFSRELRDPSTELPPTIRLGLSYSIFEQSITLLDLVYSRDLPLSFSVGQILELIENRLNLKFGLYLQEKLTKISFGTGLNLKHFELNYAGQFHPELPLTHSIGLNFKLNP